ncbi:MAG: hypothetical protein R3A12_15590 [Ignavibacteria bacterium]
MSKKSYTISLVIFLLAFYTKVLFSQDTVETTNPIFSGYIDAYGAYYTDSVGVSNFQKFPTVSPRSEEIGLNIAMITGKYSTDRIRGVLTLQYGDIPKAHGPKLIISFRKQMPGSGFPGVCGLMEDFSVLI